MLPEHLVSSHFHLSTPHPEAEGNSENLTQGKITLSDYEPDILISTNAAGQPRNVLFEERDRHIKERLFCVAKIETFTRLINALQAEGDIDAQMLSKIVAEKTTMVNEKGNAIWLNLITRETTTPLFYSLEDADDERG
ncbi:hypothetical protein [Salmonella bongori]|uniref:hypothetical protein n=1 Tax=Salmonella bongori TaxID=54736 RepID=UPI0009AAC563|nr:hypothetical protein [Salmonella bongori]